MDTKNDYIDLRVITKKVWHNKKIYFTSLPTILILSYLLILGSPRYFTSDTCMAPEMSSNSNMESLGSIASTFGVDLGQVETSDAISPLLYPNLMEDNKFIVDLFSIHIKSADETISTTYYDYLKKYQKSAWWNYPKKMITKMIKNFSSTKSNQSKPKANTSPYYLTETDNNIANSIRNNISIGVDRKTGIITISTKAQDPLICKILADSVSQRLQQYIISYRTNKAKTDVDYYMKLTFEAKHDYEKLRQSYGYFADANTDMILESVKAKQEDIENEMQLKYNAYSALNTQLQAAKAKLQERTPVFTTIKGAAVPLEPAGPKRLVFALGMTFLAFIIITIFIIKNEFVKKEE